MENIDYMKGLSSHCEEIQEVMGRVPNWMLRWGISVIAIIVCGLCIGSYFVRIPQTIPIQIYVKSLVYTDSIQAISDGIINSIPRANSSIVSYGDTILSYVDDTTQHYVLSPLMGRISYPQNRVINDHVSQGETLFYIEASNKHAEILSCYGFVAENKLSLIHPGMKVSFITSESEANDAVTAYVANISSYPNAHGLYYMELSLRDSFILKALSSNLHSPITIFPAKIEISSQRLIEKIIHL